MNPSQKIGEDQSMILINELERSLKVTLFGTKPTQHIIALFTNVTKVTYAKSY